MKQKEFKECKVCGTEFKMYRTTDKYCSGKCKMKDKKPNLKLSDMTTQKKCKICKNKFIPKNVSTEPVCQNYDCKLTYALKVVEQNKIDQEKKFKQKAKSDTTNWKSKLQTEVNKVVRLIDKGLPCLARQKNGQIHAGHVYARGGNQNIKYNLHNIHRQNAQSNHFQNDDGLLRDGVVREYGQDYMDFISSLKSTPILDLKNKEYEELTYKAKKIVLKLKKENKTYSLEKRIELRNQINIELGIYDEKFCIFNR